MSERPSNGIGAVFNRAHDGDVQAQVDLAVAFALGEGVELDLALARHWYQRAAAQGSGIAAFNLAAMMMAGEGGAKSSRDGLRWMRRASAMGSSDASVWLGESADAVGKLEEAVRFYITAGLQGDSRGMRGLWKILSDGDDARRERVVSVMGAELRRRGVRV